MKRNLFRTRKRQRMYYKPNIGALHGRVGRSIMETIMNTPKPDLTEARRKADECRAAMLADMCKEKLS